MRFRQAPGSGFHSIVSGPPAASATQHALRRRLEESRKTILCGCIVSMIGVVLYCFAMSNGDQQADLLAALSARGTLAWSALAVIFVGVGMWFTGCVGFAQDADALASEADRE